MLRKIAMLAARFGFTVAILSPSWGGGLPGCFAQLPSSGSVPVTLRPQQTNMWCWAASGQMVMENLGKLVTQCDEANRRFNTTACCGNPVPNGCVKGGWPEFDKYGFTFQTTSNAALTWDQLRTEIVTHNRPFAFTWHWNGGGGHMMVARGFAVVNGQKRVSISDPWPPNLGDERDIPYDEYVQGPDHTHWDDYFQVAHAPGAANGQPKPRDPAETKVVTGQNVDFQAAIAQSQHAAKAALGTYKQLAIEKGLVGEADAPSTLGTPFPVVFVGLNALKEPPGGDLQNALRDQTDKVLYPILRRPDGPVAAAVTVIKKDDQWSESAVGNTTLAKLLVQARLKYATEHKIPLESFYVVSIPALNSYFVATKSGKDVTLIPVIDDPVVGVKAGEADKSTVLLPKLQKAANSHDGLPR